jgi:hypothetical protein
MHRVMSTFSAITAIAMLAACGDSTTKAVEPRQGGLGPSSSARTSKTVAVRAVGDTCPIGSISIYAVPAAGGTPTFIGSLVFKTGDSTSVTLPSSDSLRLQAAMNPGTIFLQWQSLPTSYGLNPQTIPYSNVSSLYTAEGSIGRGSC